MPMQRRIPRRPRPAETAVKKPIPGISRFHFFPEVKTVPTVRQRRELHVMLSERNGELVVRLRRWNEREGVLEKKYATVREIDAAVRQAIHTQESISAEAATNRRILFSLLSNPAIKGIISKKRAQLTPEQISDAMHAIAEQVRVLRNVTKASRTATRDALLEAHNALLMGKVAKAKKPLEVARKAIIERNKVLLNTESPFFRDRELLLRGIMLYRFGRQHNFRAIRELSENQVLLNALREGSSQQQRRNAANFLAGLDRRLRGITQTYLEKVVQNLAEERARLQQVASSPLVDRAERERTLKAVESELIRAEKSRKEWELGAFGKPIEEAIHAPVRAGGTISERQKARAYLKGLPSEVSAATLMKPAPETVVYAIRSISAARAALIANDLRAARDAVETAKKHLTERNRQLASTLWPETYSQK